ncbi:MAG: NfeD family protein [Lautropia sp.]|nr:NfeD family protein [Lautropia sp.]
MEPFSSFFSGHSLWWLLAVVLGTLELFTGSFYLLVIALGLAGAGLAAWTGASAAIQLLAAAVISIVGSAMVRRFRRLGPRALRPDQNPDLNLDIGQTVVVHRWDADGTARVSYRGALWRAMVLPGHEATVGAYRIHAIQGSRLVLIPATVEARPG